MAILRNMYQQPRYSPQAEQRVLPGLAHHASPPAEGTVAREMETEPGRRRGPYAPTVRASSTPSRTVVTQRAGGMEKLLAARPGPLRHLLRALPRRPRATVRAW